MRSEQRWEHSVDGEVTEAAATSTKRGSSVSLPVVKAVGDKVTGGAINVEGVLTVHRARGSVARFGLMILLHLKQAWNVRIAQGTTSTADLLDAICEGAVLRVRPKAMTVAVAVAVILAGLFPIMWGTGTGSEVRQRIAAPMVGGMITAPLLSMFVIPAAYLLMRQRR